MGSIADRCSVCGLDPRTVSPSDAVVALRSYPRRYRALLLRPEEQRDILSRPGPDGQSALDVAAVVPATLEAAAEAIRRIQRHDDPEIRLTAATPGAAGLDEVLARLETACRRLASTIEEVEGRDWQRTGRDPHEGSCTALDVARHGVHVGIHHLRAAERVLGQVRWS